MSVLSLERVVVQHGLLHAVRRVDLEIAQGETVAIVGANGAGKTSLLRAVAGALPVSAGSIRFQGQDVSRLPAHRRVRAGIALVPEGRRLFSDLTVEENILVAQSHGRKGPWNLEAVLEAFPLLQERRQQRAGNLSGGEQQATAIGRALVTNPDLLLLDEVSLGLAPVAVEDVYWSLERVMRSGSTVVMVEQDLERAMGTADRIVCMLEGRLVLEGTASELAREQITDAYFGLAANGGGTG